MLKGFFVYYLLSRLTGNPFLGLVILIVLYTLLDKTYLGFLPDFSRPFMRNSRIRSLVSELQVNPANASAAQELGVLYFEKKKYHKALVFLQKAHERVKNSARLYLYMGMAYMESGEQEAGMTALLKAIELDRKTGHGLPYIYLIRYELDKTGVKSEAIERYESDFENFANTENFYRMGLVYKNSGRSREAGEMFRRALEEYAYVPKTLKRIHRKWALLSRLRLVA